jgi:hypothetical protein
MASHLDSDHPQPSSSEAKADIEARAAVLVNPTSGIANDYLNLFNEIVMLIDTLQHMPELIDELLVWCPPTYEDYFASSNYPGRTQALDIYQTLHPDFRREFEDTIAELTCKAAEAIAKVHQLYEQNGADHLDVWAGTCTDLAEGLRVVLDRATNLVNYGTPEAPITKQEEADSLLAAEPKRCA